MNQILEFFTMILHELERLGIERLVLAVLAFGASFATLRVLVSRLRKHVDIRPVRKTLTLSIWLIVVITTINILGHATLISIGSGVLTLILIFTTIRLIDYFVVEAWIIQRKKRSSPEYSGTQSRVLFLLFFFSFSCGQSSELTSPE